MNDFEAYDAFPNDRKWYDKYYLAKYLGYECGDTGRTPRDRTCIVRPKINLYGCGSGAFVVDTTTEIPLGNFWTPFCLGRHITVDYHRVMGVWSQKETFEGFNNRFNLQKFTGWMRVNGEIPMPTFLQGVESDFVNVEMVGDKIIEVHLRTNPDPVSYDHFIPVWYKDQVCPNGYRFIPDAPGINHLDRLGFFVRLPVPDCYK